MYVTVIDKFIEIMTPVREAFELVSTPLCSPMRSLNDRVSGVTKMPSDQSMYLTIKFFQLFLALVYRYAIPRKWFKTKYIFNLLAGILVVVVMYQSEVLYLLAFTLFGFVTVHHIPPSFNRFFSLVGFMLISFSYVCYDQMKYPGVIRYGFMNGMMQATLKMISIAFCVYDGYRIKKNKGKPLEHERNNEMALSKPPSLLKYFSFIMFYANTLNPPPIEYKHYTNSIENEDENTRGIDLRAIFQRVKWVIFYIVLISVCQKRFGWHDHMIKSEYTKDYSTIYILYLCFVHHVLLGSKLMFAALFAEVVLITAGVGYVKDEKNEDEKWENVKCVRPFEFETSPSMTSRIRSWNIGVEKMLRHYFYYRLPFPRSLNRFITAFCAAFWHGKYLGIYLFYFLVIAESQVYIQIYKVLGLKDSKHEIFGPGWLIASIFTSVMVRISGSVFFLQTWDEIRMLHVERLYYGLFLFVIMGYIVSMFFLPMLVKKKRKKKKEV